MRSVLGVGWRHLAVVGLFLAMSAPASGAVPVGSTLIAMACWVEGTAEFDHPVALVPAANRLLGLGTFDCQVTVNGGAPEAREADLSFGVYHDKPSGTFGCAASEFNGIGIVDFREPLPGGHTAIRIEFVALAQGPFFWHYGDFVELGAIVDGQYVKGIDLDATSGGMGEYVLETDTPEACFEEGFPHASFGGPAVGVLVY